MQVAGAVVVTTGEADAEVCPMIGGVVAVSFLGHLAVVMRMIITMITMAAAPPDPSRGNLMASKDSSRERAGSSTGASDSILLRTKTDPEMFNFSSFQCCSMVSIR